MDGGDECSGGRKLRSTFGTATATLYDWGQSRYHFPVMAKVPNGFPLRKPVATEKKLRQMYLNSDTVCGKLLISASLEAARRRRLEAAQREQLAAAAAATAPQSPFSILQQQLPLSRAGSGGRGGARSGSGSGSSRRSSASPELSGDWSPLVANASAPPPPVSAFGRRSAIPPINSAQGMTIVKTVLRRGGCGGADGGGPGGDDRLHLQSQLDVYLPRAVPQSASGRSRRSSRPFEQPSDEESEAPKDDSNTSDSGDHAEPESDQRSHRAAGGRRRPSGGDGGGRQQLKPPPPLPNRTESGRGANGAADGGGDASSLTSSFSSSSSAERPITATW